MGVPANVNAGDTILASQQNDLVSYSVPQNLIAIWHGTIANIPTGWLICDGNNSTPNLLQKFLQGVATAGTDPGATGGSTTHTHTTHSAHVDVSGPVSDNIQTAGATPDITPTHAAHNSPSHEPTFYDVAFIMKS